jgi:hypothetical protein
MEQNTSSADSMAPKSSVATPGKDEGWRIFQWMRSGQASRVVLSLGFLGLLVEVVALWSINNCFAGITSGPNISHDVDSSASPFPWFLPLSFGAFLLLVLTGMILWVQQFHFTQQDPVRRRVKTLGQSLTLAGISFGLSLLSVAGVVHGSDAVLSAALFLAFFPFSLSRSF